MQIRPDEWKKIFELRDDLDGEDRLLLRKLIKYTEHLEQEIRHVGDLMHRMVSRGAESHDD